MTQPTDDSFHVVSSIDHLIDFLSNKHFDDIWCIGGASIYNTFLKNKVFHVTNFMS